MSTVDTDKSRGGSIPIHEAHYNPAGEGRLSEIVIEAIAAADEVDPTDCDLGLYDAIDLEALDTLFERRSHGGHWRFEFSVADHLVAIEGDGSVTIYDA